MKKKVIVEVRPGVERWAEDLKKRSRREAKKSALELGYRPFEKQQEFHRSKAKYRLFGGAAGPGKSKALLMEAILQAHDHARVNTLLLRRTFPELEGSLLLYFRRDVPRELYRSYNDSKHVVTWWNGSQTRFGYCQSENDVYQYQGAEFLFIGIDELTLFTLKQWQFLTSRNRCPVAGCFPNMAGATNPGNIGHAWVKALWVDKVPAPGMDGATEYDPADYEFISAKVWDNPIYARDKNYVKTLRALPSRLRRPFLDGDWSVFEGQYFELFDPGKHVERAENVGMESWWPRWISIDWGYEHPAAVYWHAAGPRKKEEADEEKAATRVGDSKNDGKGPIRKDQFSGEEPCGSSGATDGRATVWGTRGNFQGNDKSNEEDNGEGSGNGDAERAAAKMAVVVKQAKRKMRVVTYRELVRQRVGPRLLAQMIVDMSKEGGKADGKFGEDDREKIQAVYLSPDAFARRTDEATIADQMGDVLVAGGLPRPERADDDRIGGWILMQQMLAEGDWTIAGNCAELIRVLPTMLRDDARVEDIAKFDGDDAADAARYGLKSHTVAQSMLHPPVQARIAEKVISADPTIRAIQAKKANLEVKGRGIGAVKRRGKK
jgi:Terminase large subunit, T4likevirus-type, N-terminal